MLISVAVIELPGDSSLVLYARGMDEVAVLRQVRRGVSEGHRLIPFEVPREHIERYHVNIQEVS